MPRRARTALLGAAIAVPALILVWYCAHYVGPVRRADANILSGFLGLQRPGLSRVTQQIATLGDPQKYVFLAAVPVVVALLRGRPRVAVALAVLLLGANETTQLLKPHLAGPRVVLPADPITLASYPSGHATASMALALAMVIASPTRLRPVVSALMTAFTLAVCFSFLELGWHYPSDVLGGYLVAGTWTLLVVAVLSTYEALRPPQPRPALAGGGRAPVSTRQALLPSVLVAAAGLVLAAIVALARPHDVVAYARGHETFVVGAAAIAVAAFAVASVVTVVLRRPS